MKVNRGLTHVSTLIPFMNKVFRKNFPKLLPKLYTSDKYAPNHYYVEDNGVLVGTLASIPNTLHIGNKTLTTRGVGMVAAHKKCRGKGIMSSMLKKAISDAKDENVDIMYLSGNRQRYEHYGFVPCGYKHTFTMCKANYKHMLDGIDYTFEPLDSDSPHLSAVIKIYNDSRIRYERDDFVKVLHSWNIKKAYAVLDKDGVVVGHIAILWGKIVDYATSESRNLPYIVKAFAKYCPSFLGRIEVNALDTEGVKAMSRYAQSSSISEPAFFNILNYRHVVEVLLTNDAMCEELVDFDINIDIENRERFNVRCVGGNIYVGDYNSNAMTYHFRESEATLMLFSPNMRAYNGLPFSLRLFIPMCDNV